MFPRESRRSLSIGRATAVRTDLEPNRCGWARTGDSSLLSYHDQEWGVPLHDDGKLFELLTLEGFQAGLSWGTILKKREGFRRRFDGFDPRKVAKYDERRVRSLKSDPGIVRNELKIRSAIGNAKSFLAVQGEFGSFDSYVWGFVGNRPRTNAWHEAREVPAKTLQSDALSADLTKRGFKFVGSTICYAFMQSTGMVNDHIVSCFRHEELGGPRDRPGGRLRPTT